MSETTDFRPGLEGVVAVETEIAEPDRDGGSLRYRGVDIEELVGRVPYENVWGLLVDDDLGSRMPDPEPYQPASLTGNAPADLQAETARLAGEWGLGKLNEISDEQARDDLGRLSAQMMSIVARSARVADGHADPVPDDVVAQGKTAAETFLLRWRGEADPRHVKAIDTYWICTAEHGLNASTFTARIVASTGADCGAALSAAVGALSGPLHGGAPAYVIPMLEEVSERGDAQAWVDDALASGKRIMGFGHRIYRAEDPRSRILKQTAQEISVRRTSTSPSRSSRWRSPRSRNVIPSACWRRTLSTTRPSCSTSLTSRLRSRRRCSPARGLRAGRHISSSRRRLVVSSDRRLGTSGPKSGRSRLSRDVGRVTLAEAAAEADVLAQAGDERALAKLRTEWDDELEAAARNSDYRIRAQAYRAIAQFRFRQKRELLRRGLEDESPAARGSALIALEGMSRDHPGDVNAYRPLLHELAARDPNVAVQRLAVICLKNGTPHRDTIQLLEGIAESDEADADLRKTARVVQAALKKKAAAR